MRSFNIVVSGNLYQVALEEIDGASAPQSILQALQTTAPVAAIPQFMPAAPAPAPMAAPAAAPESPAPTPSAPASSAFVTGGAQGSVEISAPMPGKILKVSAAMGEMVKKGSVIAILEAMKMENEIVAHQDGAVASIHVKVGDNIEPGQLILTLN